MEEYLDYEKYEDRLRTFTTWPSDGPMIIKDLVEAGFYYTGRNDVVSCFLCGIEIGNWKENEQPLVLHSQRSEQCQYLIERKEKHEKVKGSSFNDNGNQLVTDPSPRTCSVDETSPKDCAVLSPPNESLNDSDDYSEVYAQVGFSACENRLISINKYQPSISTAQAKRISDAGFFFNETGKCFECYHCHSQFDIAEMVESSDPVLLHAEASPTCKFISLVIEDQALYHRHHENSKAETLVPDTRNSLPDRTRGGHDEGNSRTCTVSQFIDDQECKQVNSSSENCLRLKMPGRNNGQSIVVETPSVKTYFRSEAPDTSRHLSTSSVVTGSLQSIMPTNVSPGNFLLPSGQPDNNAIQNSPGSPISSTSSPLYGPRHHFLQHQDSVKSNTSDDEMMFREYSSGGLVQRQNSFGSKASHKSSDLKSKYVRLSTFFTWPQNSPIQPLELSEAGFYFTGVDDGVKCFKCGIALKSWVQGDTAWGEHRKWSPQCPLVIEHMNQNTNQISQRQTTNHDPRIQQRREIDRTSDFFHGNAEIQRQNDPTSLPTQISPFFLPPANSMNIIQPPTLMTSMDPFGRLGNPDISFALPGNRDANQSEPAFYPTGVPETNAEESNEVEQVGPLSIVDFDKLLEAGFTVEMINKTQSLALDKYGKYFDNLEATADAVLFVLEHGNLDEHCLSEKREDSGEGPQDLRKKQANLEDKQSGPQSDLKRELDKMREMQLCKICMDEQVGIAFHPCGHLCTCHNCSVGMTQCPLCRANIQSSSRVYLG
ncbi:baculoviral IAP repeat-containing protein 3-like [Rhopilema esculentum]|uniref:baculoviral IAP repeat-containing protein 3-like n=1 Tax=Rhopilema esculentum TaxID=499914 RepID=UPI0031D24AA6|eukprot:gene17615-9255_t